MTRKFTPTSIKLRTPVPSDIDIAQEATLKSILQVAEEVGIQPIEMELHGLTWPRSSWRSSSV